jgi:hypothetical protein
LLQEHDAALIDNSSVISSASKLRMEHNLSRLT